MSEQTFLTLFAAEGKKKLEGGLELRVVPAFSVLQARREAMEKSEGQEQTLGLWMNACLLSRAVYRDEVQAFEDGETVLRAVSAETIERWMQAYAALCKEENPPCSAELAQQAVKALEQEPYERVKWRVLRAFGVLPSEARARQMTDRDYLYCAAQMMLDEEQKLDALCPSCREKAQRMSCPVCGAQIAEQNERFDERRFEELRDAGICKTASAGADEACGAV